MASKDYTNHIVGGAVLIILILVGVFLVVNNNKSSPVVGTDTDSSTGSNSTATNDTLSAANQVAGTSVMVTGLNVSQESWVAVRDASGMRVLGAARVQPGVKSVTVPLLRATAAGSNYQTVIYADDGDKQFDLHKDTLVEGVTATFSAQ